MSRSEHFRVIAVVLAAIALEAVVWPALAVAEIPAIASRQRAEKKTFTDSDVIDGFLKTAFGAEYHLAGRVDRIRKYQTPVRVFADGNRSDRKAQIAKIVGEIAKRVQHLDIAMAETRDDANVLVTLVRDRDLNRTISNFYGNERAREIHGSLDPQCLSGFRKNEKFEIERSDVILTVDNGDFTFFDCAYEELLQSLGPINDTDRACPGPCSTTMCRWDSSASTTSTSSTCCYDPRIKAGMTVAEVKEVLPAVLVDVRAWVKTVGIILTGIEPVIARIGPLRCRDDCESYADFSNSSRPISMRRISLVPAPIS